MLYLLMALLPFILALSSAFAVGIGKLASFNLPLDQIGIGLALSLIGTVLVNPIGHKQRRLTYGFFEDWDKFIDTEDWTKLDADTGSTVTLDADGGNGVLTLVAATTDNNEAYISRTNENFDWVQDKSQSCAVDLDYTEINVDDANVAFGFIDAPGANTIVDDGGGIKTSFSGAVIYKVDGDTLWQFITSKGTAQIKSASDKTAGGAQRLEIDVRMLDATFCEIAPFVDGEQLQDSKGVLIKHRFDYTSATQQSVFVGLKTGAAQTETLNVDWISADRKR